MGGCAFLLLHLLLNVMADSTDVEVEKNVLGVLGEAALLRCRYTGHSDVSFSSWSQQQTNGRWKPLFRYHTNQFRTYDPRFSALMSPSNLTVMMNVSSLEDEKEYKCSFITDTEETDETVTLSVRVRPSVQTDVVETVETGTHYQTVNCSAAAAKPEAAVSWLVNGSRPRQGAFSVTTATQRHHNGTSTQTSTLRMPTHLLDVGYVTCVVNHSTSAAPTHVRVKVQSFVAPVVTMETNLLQTEGEVFQVVTCRGVGGRPVPSFSWFPPGNVSVEVQEDQEVDTDKDTVTSISSLQLPAHLHEGQNITCVVTHPRFPQEQRRSLTLPTFSLTSLQVLTPESLVVEEGQKNVTIQFQVVGSVPRYQITCARADGPLPADVAVIGSSLWLGGPIGFHHAGRYECGASYFHHRASVRLDIQVTPVEQEQVVIPPNITTHTWENATHRAVHCSASGSTPAANVSWVLPGGLPAATWSNTTPRSDGTQDVSAVLLLPVCWPEELQLECVIEHPSLAAAERRPVTLPACSGPTVSLHSSTVWDGHTQYAQVECRVESREPAAAIAWSVQGGAGRYEQVPATNRTHRNGSMTVLSLVRLPARWMSERTVVCTVSHETLDTKLREQIQLPAADPPIVHLSVREHPNSPLWLAVCESTWDVGTFNLSWTLPENNTARIAWQSGSTGGRFWANSTYEFPLELHEGHNLTCQFKTEDLAMEETVHVPLYYISSLRLLHSNVMSSREQDRNCPLLQRVVLQTHLRDQRVQLKVCGRMPGVNVICTRSNGLLVQMEGSSMVFPSQLSVQDAGLYTCRASFYHHRASLCLQVEVIEVEEEIWNIAIICFPTACAIILILTVCLCVFCNRHRSDPSATKRSCGKTESLAALTSLMAEHRSPELKKTPGTSKDNGHQYPELVRYSIVIDIKTTV